MCIIIILLPRRTSFGSGVVVNKQGVKTMEGFIQDLLWSAWDGSLVQMHYHFLCNNSSKT